MSDWVWMTLVGVVIVWVAFNVLASYAVLLTAELISPGRLPAELLRRGEAKNLRFYVGNTVMSYGFSLWIPGKGVVVLFNRAFFRQASPELVRFVVAHELGHAAANHNFWKWLAVAFGVALLPGVRRALAEQERVADNYATLLTGFKREHFVQLREPE